MDLVDNALELAAAVDALRFAAPVAHVYNPLRYAWEPHRQYLERYGRAPKAVLMVGMNPGPFGMTQTGVPFGDVVMVRDWLGIDAPVRRPPHEHPKRPIEGWACRRREVSGQRVWNWARSAFGTPQRFFERVFVPNYCPLVFLEASGRNLTPDKLPPAEREPLYAACDRALRHTVERLRPRLVVGIGRFAEGRIRTLLADTDITVAGLTHPSPANPRARDWGAQASQCLRDHGFIPPEEV